MLAVAWLVGAGSRTARRRLDGRLGTDDLPEPRQRGGLSPGAALWAALCSAACWRRRIAAVAIHPPRTLLAGCLAGILVLLEPVLVLAAAVAAMVYWWGAGRASGSGRTGRAALGRLMILAGVAAAIIGCWYGGRWLQGPATGNSPAGGGQIGLQRLRDFLLSGHSRPGP